MRGPDELSIANGAERKAAPFFQFLLTRQSFAPAPFAAPGRISDIPSDPAYVPPDAVRR